MEDTIIVESPAGLEGLVSATFAAPPFFETINDALFFGVIYSIAILFMDCCFPLPFFFISKVLFYFRVPCQTAVNSSRKCVAYVDAHLSIGGRVYVLFHFFFSGPC